jgi:hypothetical protein
MCGDRAGQGRDPLVRQELGHEAEARGGVDTELFRPAT